MKFFIENQKVEKELEWVKAQVRLHMNGAASSQMEERGIKYRVNYGVALPHLKQLAKKIPVGYELAQRLWFLQIRETMLLAALTVSEKDMTQQRCIEWGEKIDNKDLVERSAMLLWSRIDGLDEVLDKWLNEGDQYLKATAFYTIGRKLQLGRHPENSTIKKLIELIKEDDSALVYAALAYALRQHIRLSRNDVELYTVFVSRLKEQPESFKKAIAIELETELDLFNL